MAFSRAVGSEVRSSAGDGSTIAVGLGEMVVTSAVTCVLVAYGLGSCIGLAAYDPTGPVAGMLHAVLPHHRGGEPNLAKFVDTGIPLLIEEMRRHGARMERVRWFAAGGAQMLTAPGFRGMFNIGAQNIQSMEQVLAQHGIRLSGSALAGHVGRTLKLYVDTGLVTVRSAGQEEVPLSK